MKFLCIHLQAFFLSFILLQFDVITKAEVYSQSPEVKVTATKGMVIDAGSGGSRLHIYSWKPRIFRTVPPPISFPEANERWTGRMDPGIASFANNPAEISAHLAPLIDFAKVTLGGLEEHFGDYPIYFKATGGMRELESSQREEILRYVRKYLSDKSFCPFFFRNDFARVISGEEEAIFSWAATNFLMGTLLPASQGVGSVVGVNRTFGTLDLGGSSTQIAFYVPNQNINEGLYNLQIGGQKHWNVYTKSFLQFGIVSARLRHMNDVADQFVATHHKQFKPPAARALATTGPPTSFASGSGALPKAVDYCLHSGYSETATDSSGTHTVDVAGPASPSERQLELCMDSVRSLMEKKYGAFCEKVHHGDCSIAGAYQPPIPEGQHGHFIGQSSYKYPWNFLRMPQTASLELFKARAAHVCSLSFGDVLFYFESNNLAGNPNKLSAYLPYYCFLTSYVLVLLQDGYRFSLNQTLTVQDQVNGHSVGWALGAILYEINELPWELEVSAIEAHPWGFVLAAACIGFSIGAAAAVCIYRAVVEDKRPSSFSSGPRPRVGGGGSGIGGSDREYEALSRVPTLDMIESSGIGGAGAAFPKPHKRNGSLSVNSSNNSSAPGSPSAALSRKSLLPSPYASPVKSSSGSGAGKSFGGGGGGIAGGIAGMDSNSSGSSSGGSVLSGLFKGMPPFQRAGGSGRYEPISDL